MNYDVCEACGCKSKLTIYLYEYDKSYHPRCFFEKLKNDPKNEELRDFAVEMIHQLRIWEIGAKVWREEIEELLDSAVEVKREYKIS